jgi:anti-sigma regulatory factor (Ser/Thr protein kinase)
VLQHWSIPAFGATLSVTGAHDTMTETIRSALPRDPSCGSVARRLVQEHLEGQLEPTLLGDAQTVISELVNNAYVHGAGNIELRFQLLEDRLRVEVVDEGQGAAIHVREQGPHAGGHGLNIVQTLSSTWGAFEGTTHVWAELATVREDPEALPL